MAYHFENLYFKRFQFGSISEVLVSSLEGSEALKRFGTEYQVGMYVCSGVENEMPLFCRIVSSIIVGMTTLIF